MTGFRARMFSGMSVGPPGCGPSGRLSPRAPVETTTTAASITTAAVPHEPAFQLAGGTWNELGDAAVHELSPARRDLLDAIDDLGGTARNKELSEHLGKTQAAVLEQLQGLEADGLVHQVGKGGPWQRTPNAPNRPNSKDPELGELGPLGQLWEEEE